MIALMNILFITASRIGDAVLSTGLLDYIARTHLDAKVTIVCGPLCASLFSGYPLLQEVIPLKKEKRHKHWVKLWRRVVGTRVPRKKQRLLVKVHVEEMLGRERGAEKLSERRAIDG